MESFHSLQHVTYIYHMRQPGQNDNKLILHDRKWLTYLQLFPEFLPLAGRWWQLLWVNCKISINRVPREGHPYWSDSGVLWLTKAHKSRMISPKRHAHPKDYPDKNIIYSVQHKSNLCLAVPNLHTEQ